VQWPPRSSPKRRGLVTGSEIDQNGGTPSIKEETQKVVRSVN